MAEELLTIMVSRHSAFYSPLIAATCGGFLHRAGFKARYRVLERGQRSRDLIRNGDVDVMQSAVGSNWLAMAGGDTSDLPVHFAQINTKDGFFLTGREPNESFEWKHLEGKSVLADHGSQPLLMLRYAAKQQGLDWDAVEVIDAGGVEEIDKAFRDGRGDFVHQQAPRAQQLERDGHGFVLDAVGDAMPEVAFSSLCASREFVESDRARAFCQAYKEAREWVRSSPPQQVAGAEQSFFPGTGSEVLTESIARYQKLGCWQGDIAIPRDLYDRALDVFLSGGAIQERYAYEDVVVDPPA